MEDNSPASSLMCSIPTARCFRYRRGVGVPSLRGRGWSNSPGIGARTGGPHSHARIPVFKKNKRPTSVVESYKTTNGHEAVVLMSVVEERAENICSLRAFPVLNPYRKSRLLTNGRCHVAKYWAAKHILHPVRGREWTVLATVLPVRPAADG